ncbi:hypothetical protein [Microbacterium testaceum]|uniref:hypothetical protein n=1 Tax=Microbacterium testaceum TaxID=2033 RepID=UPI0012464387|nr:hypothetical protein [Microbacterium testaceum]
MRDSEVSPWASIVGPCYTSKSCADELGLTVPGLVRATQEMRALRLTTRDGIELHPSFQIRDRQLLPGLEQVLLILQTGLGDPWTWAQWLNAEVDGRRHVNKLWAGNLEVVLREARHDAWAWRS